MKYIIKLTLILAAFCAIASFGLGYVYTMTESRIAEQRRLAKQQALDEVLPSAQLILPVTEIKDRELYRAYATKDSSTPVLGYAFISRGQGYSSKIQTMVGIDTVGIIQGISVLYQQETPGLGAKILEVRSGEKKPWFQQQFEELKAISVAVTKDGGTIKSITGATISSRAVTNSIKKEAQWLKDQGFIKP